MRYSKQLRNGKLYDQTLYGESIERSPIYTLPRKLLIVEALAIYLQKLEVGGFDLRARKSGDAHCWTPIREVLYPTSIYG